MPRMPKRTKFRKEFRRASRVFDRKATKGNYVAYGEFGLQALEPAWMTARQIEASRIAAQHYLKRQGKVYIRVFPDKPVSKKPLEQRMGKGKADTDYWAARVKEGTMLFEIAGVPEEMARTAMARIAQEAGHSLLWGANSPHAVGGDRGQQAIDLCDRYIRDQVGGVFFAPVEHAADKDSVNARIIASFSHAKIPVVLLDRDYVPYPERSPYDLVGIDNRRVGYSITHHLFRRGCEKVMFFARPGSAATLAARVAGFMEAVVKDAGAFESMLVQRCDPRDASSIGELVSTHRPDGIVCGNDVTAGKLMHTLDQLGLEVPEDVMVGGIDDVKYAELLRVPLTTVRQPCGAIGEAAFHTMLSRIESPDAVARDVLIGCDLIERESTKRLGHGAAS